jgi:hypothetical protein
MCAASTFQLSGSLAGGSDETMESVDQYAFANGLGSAPGSLDVTLAAGSGKLHLEWPGLMADDMPTAVTGTYSDSFGKQFCLDAAMLEVHSTAPGASFAITSSAESASCPGEPVSGAAVGCAAGK